MLKKICLLFLTLLIPAILHAQGSGDVLFASKCAQCHGKDGAGKTPFAEKARIPDLASHEVQSLSDRQLYDSIARGTGHKAYPHSFALRGMTIGEVESLVKKIRDLKK